MGQARFRELTVDVGLGIAVAVVVGVAVGAGVRGPSPPPAVAFLWPLAFGVLILARRRFPVLTLLATATGLIAYYLADLPPIGLAIPVAAALYSAAEAGRLRWAAGTAVVLLVISTVARLHEGDDAGYLLGFELASTVGLMVAVIALGDGVRSRRLLQAEQRRTAEQATRDREQEAARRVQEERVRIARDLHDVLAHSVAVISLQAAVAAEALPGEPATAAAALDVIRRSGADAMAELRGTLGLLRDGEEAVGRAPVGGVAQLDRLARSTTGSGLPVTLRVEGDSVDLPVAVDATAYRIVQESLTNALRHAGARHAEVLLRYGRDLRISVIDDGRGGHVGDGSGQGLRGMRERAALLGGTVLAGPGEGGGFRVDATLPLAPGAS